MPPLPDEPCLPPRADEIFRAAEVLPSADVDRPALRLTPPTYVQRLIETPIEERGGIIEEIRRKIGPVGALVVFGAEGVKPELR